MPIARKFPFDVALMTAPGLRALGTWKGNAMEFGQPAYRDANERSAILIQQGIGGRIIAAKRL